MDVLQNYLVVAAILFVLGIYCVMTRRNGIAVLMGIELILNAANLNFLAFAKYGGMNLSGHLFALFVIIMAAAEAAVALAIIINLYNHYRTINVDEASKLKQ
jgi:NADH-quinone oxidoreductase subunit K